MATKAFLFGGGGGYTSCFLGCHCIYVFIYIVCHMYIGLFDITLLLHKNKIYYRQKEMKDNLNLELITLYTKFNAVLVHKIKVK